MQEVGLMKGRIREEGGGKLRSLLEARAEDALTLTTIEVPLAFLITNQYAEKSGRPVDLEYRSGPITGSGECGDLALTSVGLRSEKTRLVLDMERTLINHLTKETTMLRRNKATCGPFLDPSAIAGPHLRLLQSKTQQQQQQQQQQGISTATADDKADSS
ncbi:hypothetical protein PoB_001586800 [Plakobranchus ocellatus]|uniref:Uncharacterized protein n=1 Tax=Plakobranchus ocellatus TaxID=259542 RepID=A0AAV3Z4I8_9GAST|nr:hypothetical protein PoB_001586800 [Plakobranchus ocellatus]